MKRKIYYLLSACIILIVFFNLSKIVFLLTLFLLLFIISNKILVRLIYQKKKNFPSRNNIYSNYERNFESILFGDLFQNDVVQNTRIIDFRFKKNSILYIYLFIQNFHSLLIRDGLITIYLKNDTIVNTKNSFIRYFDFFLDKFLLRKYFPDNYDKIIEFIFMPLNKNRCYSKSINSFPIMYPLTSFSFLFNKNFIVKTKTNTTVNNLILLEELLRFSFERNYQVKIIIENDTNYYLINNQLSLDSAIMRIRSKYL
jgi:hypothetical protein